MLASKLCTISRRVSRRLVTGVVLIVGSSLGTENSDRTSETENSITTAQRTLISRSLTQITADHTGVVGNGYFRVGQVWMPNLFPFEAIEALIARRSQRINLALDGDVSSASKHVFAVRSSTNSILQMSMADPSVQIMHRRFWVLIGADKSVKCVPQQPNVRGISPLQDLTQVRR